MTSSHLELLSEIFNEVSRGLSTIAELLVLFPGDTVQAVDRDKNSEPTLQAYKS